METTDKPKKKSAPKKKHNGHGSAKEAKRAADRTALANKIDTKERECASCDRNIEEAKETIKKAQAKLKSEQKKKKTNTRELKSLRGKLRKVA